MSSVRHSPHSHVVGSQRSVDSVVTQEEIENRALRYLLIHLGDTATVRVERDNSHWRVLVYSSRTPEPLGQLAYSASGEILLERSTPVEELQQQIPGDVARS